MKWIIRCKFICLLFSFFWASCNSNSKPDLHNINVEWSDGEIHPAGDPGDSAVKVFVFISPECPLCISFTQTISLLADTFKNQGVRIFTVFPGEYYSTEEIKNFQGEYNLQLPALFDTKNEITKALNATVTPEAVLLNRSGEVVYSGAIDNRAFAPGKKRQSITEFYLRDAIIATLAGQKPDPQITEAIGCFIEF